MSTPVEKDSGGASHQKVICIVGQGIPRADLSYICDAWFQNDSEVNLVAVNRPRTLSRYPKELSIIYLAKSLSIAALEETIARASRLIPVPHCSGWVKREPQETTLKLVDLVGIQTWVNAPKFSLKDR